MLPKSKQHAAAAKQARKFISRPLDVTRYAYQNTENDAALLPGVCRVCLNVDVRMYHISEHELSAMYERVTGVQIKSEDKLPRQLCWECVGRLSSANRFIQKALKTQWILSEIIRNSRLIKISDIELIDKAQHKLESTLGRKYHNVNEYDFMFAEEMVEPSNFCNISINQLAKHIKNEDFSDIEPIDKGEEQIFIKEEWTNEEEPIMTEQAATAKEIHNNTIADKGAGTDGKESETYIKNANIGNYDTAISIKEELTYDDESISDMSQERRQAVDKSSEVCESIKQSFVKRNNKLLPLWNRNEQSSTMPPGHNEQVMVVEDMGFTKCNTQETANADQSTKHIERLKMKNELCSPTKNKILLEDNLLVEISSCILDTIKIPKCEQSFVSIPGSASQSVNTNTTMRQKSKKLILSRTEYPQELFICDICDKSFPQKPTLILHMQNHPKMYYCTYCSYKSYRKPGVETHINATHTKSEVFNCSDCNFKTYTKSNFFRHVAKHTKCDSLKCPHCSYKTYRKSLFQQHVNTKHTKNEVFNCPHCSYKSYRKQTLQQHLNARHTKSEGLNCPYCSYKPYQKTELQKHVNAKHTKSFYYFCAQCSYKSYFKSSLVRHVNKKHKQI